MDVILLQNVENLGRAGEVASVAPGYARNYLVPQGLAVVASKSELKALAERERHSHLRSAKLKKIASDKAASFSEVSCTIAVQANEEEHLYGSVGEREIAKALQELGHEVDHGMVVLPEHIKQLGVYTVPLKLHAEVEVPVKVWVVRAEA